MLELAPREGRQPKTALVTHGFSPQRAYMLQYVAAQMGGSGLGEHEVRIHWTVNNTDQTLVPEEETRGRARAITSRYRVRTSIFGPDIDLLLDLTNQGIAALEARGPGINPDMRLSPVSRKIFTETIADEIAKLTTV